MVLRSVSYFRECDQGHEHVQHRDRDRGRNEDPGNQVALRNPGNNYRAAEYDDEQIDRLSNAVALRLRTNDQGN